MKRSAAPVSSLADTLGHHTGQVLAGKYRLVRMIGETAAAAVWMAEHTKRRMTVALELRRPGPGDPHARERMVLDTLRRAEVIHPNLLRIYDCGRTERGAPYLATELLRGPNLEEWVGTQGPLSPTEALRLILPIAHGLSTLHAVGLVHLDVSPRNIVFAADPVGNICPKLIRFSSAERVGEIGRASTDGRLVLGDSAHASPELVQGRTDIDQRADVWSFCAVLYEVVSGRPPFSGEDLAGLLKAIDSGSSPTLEQLDIDHSELSTIVARGLAKSVAQRWPDTRSLGKSLARWLLRQGVEDDITGRSLHASWMADGSSVAPVTLDHDRGPLPGANDPYEPPKTGIFRASAGLIGAGVVFGLIVVAGLYTAGVFEPRPRVRNAEPRLARTAEPVVPRASVAPPPPAATEGVTAEAEDAAPIAEPTRGLEFEAEEQRIAPTPRAKRKVPRWFSRMAPAPAASESTVLPTPRPPPPSLAGSGEHPPVFDNPYGPSPDAGHAPPSSTNDLRPNPYGEAPTDKAPVPNPGF